MITSVIGQSLRVAIEQLAIILVGIVMMIFIVFKCEYIKLYSLFWSSVLLIF